MLRVSRSNILKNPVARKSFPVTFTSDLLHGYLRAEFVKMEKYWMQLASLETDGAPFFYYTFLALHLFYTFS